MGKAFRFCGTQYYFKSELVAFIYEFIGSSVVMALLGFSLLVFGFILKGGAW